MAAILLAERQRRRLRAARIAHGLGVADLAQALGVSRPYVAMLESGTKRPSEELLTRWATVVGFQVAIETRVRLTPEKAG